MDTTRIPDITEELMILVIDAYWRASEQVMTHAKSWESTKRGLDREHKLIKTPQAKEYFAAGGRMGMKSGFFHGFLGQKLNDTPPDKQPIPFCTAYIIMYKLGHEMGRTCSRQYSNRILERFNNRFLTAIRTVLE